MSDSTTNHDLPPIPTELLEALEAMMPELHPRLDWSERKIFQEVGQRDYLKMLRVVHDRQQEDTSILG